MDKTKALQNLLKGKATDEEIEALQQALASGEISIGGDVNRSVVIIGSGNKVELTPEALGILKPEIKAEEPVADEPPYMGLRYFDTQDADLFYGREALTRELLARVQKESFLAIVGASGSGKSSVVLAGLVPQLLKDSSYSITHFRPTNDPFLSLAKALLPLYDPKLTKTELIIESRKLAQNIKSNQITMSDIVSTALEAHSNRRVCLIADQFEELYTLSQDMVSNCQFIDFLLSGLSNSTQGIFKCIIIIRGDFLNQASLYRPLADAMQGTTMILGPMNQTELLQAIEAPAKKLNVSFEDGLVERILNDVGKESGNLPLLEFALTELWGLQRKRTLTHSAYSEIGGVSGALSRYADKIYEGLDNREKVAARSIFIQLVKPGQGTEDTRRLATINELGDDNWPLVAVLASKRLITTNVIGDRQQTAELIHEALIRNWNLLQNWLNGDREFRIWQERLRNDLKEWIDSNKEKTALMRSYSLSEAKHWLNNRPNDISEAERELIETSMSVHKQQEQQRYMVFFNHNFDCCYHHNITYFYFSIASEAMNIL